MADCPKCPECKPGLPGWMATFSDLVTLLLTFFVLLLSFAKTESAKYESALGSLRDAFGGNVLKHGEVIQRGKSADNQPSMIESQEPIKPFPIDFLTMEGILDKKEINRESTENLNDMKKDLAQFNLSDMADVYETAEGIRVNMKDVIIFKKGTAEIEEISVEAYEKLVKMLASKDWTVFVQGHASPGETSIDGSLDAFSLSSARAAAVSRSLVQRGVRPNKITTVFYGDTRNVNIQGQSKELLDRLSRRVEFTMRKTDLTTEGHKVDSQ
jgi:chemotaxis protein MotB